MTNATDNRTTELLPCPFCGGEADVMLTQGRYGQSYSIHHESHGNCAAKYVNTVNFRTEAEAIEAWNTRHVETCENMEKRNASLWFACSKCGAQAGNGTYSEEWMYQDHTDEEYAEYDGEAFKYCPNCGAKVIKEVDNADK